MTQRFDTLPFVFAAALVALVACAHERDRAATAMDTPPFLPSALGGNDEPTGAIDAGPAPKSEAKAAAPVTSGDGTIDVNQRLSALELDMAALKIELSRMSEFDSRLTELEGGSPHSAMLLEPKAETPPPKLKVPPMAGEAPLPAPVSAKSKASTPMPDEVAVPASVAALEPVAAPKAAAPKSEEPKVEAAPAAAASPVAASSDGTFALQLAAYGDAEGATKGWTNLSAAAGPLLADLNPRREEADVPGLGKVYRLKAGPFKNRSAADQRCTSLAAEGYACIVTAFTGTWP